MSVVVRRAETVCYPRARIVLRAPKNRQGRRARSSMSKTFFILQGIQINIACCKPIGSRC